MSFIPTDYSQIQKQLKAEKENSYWGGYFKPGVYGGTPTQKKSYSGRILPAFNYALSQADSEFQTSWMPYRNADNIDSETNQPVLSAFFAVVAAYSWFGNKQVSFLSPSTLRFTHSVSKGPELIDPVQDIRNFAKKHEDPAIRALTERPENKKDAKIVIPYPQRRYVFNFYGNNGVDRNPRNYLIDVSQKAFEDLAGKLSEWRPAHEQTIDPNWSNYLYGDITDPQSGVMVETTSIPSNPQPFNGFVFTTGSHKSLKGVRQYPVPPEALAGRYHLYGDNSAFKIMGAQEIVEFLVEDGAIPYHLIEEVCSNYAHVPARPNKGTVFPGSASEEDDMDSYRPPVVNPFAQKPAAPAIKPAPAPVHTTEAPPWEMPASMNTPPPPPAPAEERFWASMNGNIDDNTYTRPEVQDIINKNPGYTFMLCSTGANSAWQTPAESGFTVQVNKPKPPAPPPAMSAPPSLPQPVAAPVLPAMASTPPPVVSATNAASTVSALTDEERAEHVKLKAQFDAGTLPTADLMKFVQYVNRIEKA
jgi:hypothetical protein